MKDVILMTIEDNSGKLYFKVPYMARFAEVLRLYFDDEDRDRSKGYGYQPTTQSWCFAEEHRYVIEDILYQMFPGVQLNLVEAI